jgi:hypothetical protein
MPQMRDHDPPPRDIGGDVTKARRNMIVGQAMKAVAPDTFVGQRAWQRKGCGSRP